MFSKHRQSTWVLGTVVSTWKTQILIFTIAPLEQVLLLSPFWRENGVIKRLSNLLKIIEIGKARIRNLYSESLDPSFYPLIYAVPVPSPPASPATRGNSLSLTASVIPLWLTLSHGEPSYHRTSIAFICSSRPPLRILVLLNNISDACYKSYFYISWGEHKLCTMLNKYLVLTSTWIPRHCGYFIY